MLIVARARTASRRHRRLHFELAQKTPALRFGPQLLLGEYEGSCPRGLLLIIVLILLLLLLLLLFVVLFVLLAVLSVVLAVLVLVLVVLAVLGLLLFLLGFLLRCR